MRCIHQGAGKVSVTRQLTCSICSVDQQKELRTHPCRIRHTDANAKSREAGLQLVLVRSGDYASRMLIIRKLRRSIQERAASKIRLANSPRHTNKQGIEQRKWIVSMFLNDLVPPYPEQAVSLSHKGRNQRIFGLESPV